MGDQGKRIWWPSREEILQQRKKAFNKWISSIRRKHGVY